MGMVHARRVDELLPIGEFSRRCGLSPKMLRSYADAGLLVPTAIDRVSGYRYYAEGQVRDARVVAALRQAAIPIADIRAFMGRPTAAKFEQWEQQLEDEIRARRVGLSRARELMVFEPVLDAGSAPAGHTRDRHRGATAMPALRSSAATDIGRVRSANQDVVYADRRFVCVADGMGGAPGGGLAAQTAVAAVRDALDTVPMIELRDAVIAANRQV